MSAHPHEAAKACAPYPVSLDSIVQSNDLWRDAHWFAIQAKARRENFGATNLSALGIEILLPRIKFERLLRGTTLERTKPLFPGYFFARFCPRDSFASVKAARGVLQVLSAGRIPIPVDDRVIRDIRSRMQEDGLIRLRPLDLAPGTRVTIQNGAFAGMMGRVERELEDRKRVAILLEALFHARLIIERRWIDAEAA
jgi:transcriptional antiterminator RfaH